MFLTRFEINAARRGAQKLLGSPQAMHAAVLSSFPPSEQAERVLWRIDSGSVHHRLYMASRREPDLAHLVEQAGWPTTETWMTRDYSSLLASLKAGQEWGFRLTANPTRSVRLGEKTRSQRVGHVTAAHQLEWFTSRTHQWGFDTTGDEGPRAAVTRRATRNFRRKGQGVTLVVAQFDGVLRVTDPDALRRVLTEGIGPAKAYGCGLLTLAPTTSTAT